MSKDYKLPDGYEVRIYDFGGLDVKSDAGKWIAVASTPEACAELARIAMIAADGEKQEWPPGLCGTCDGHGCPVCRAEPEPMDYVQQITSHKQLTAEDIESIIEDCERIADGGQLRSEVARAIQMIRRQRDEATTEMRRIQRELHERDA